MELGDLTLLRKIKISRKHNIWQWRGLTNQILLKVEIHVMSSQKKAEIRHKEYEQNNEASPVMCHVLMSCECYDTHVLFNNPHQLWETSTSSTELLLLFVFHNELTASTHNEAVVLLSLENLSSHLTPNKFLAKTHKLFNFLLLALYFRFSFLMQELLINQLKSCYPIL